MLKEPNAGTLEFYRTRHAAETVLTLRLFQSFISADLSYKPHERSASARDIVWTIVKGLIIRNDVAARADAETSLGSASSFDVLIWQFEELSASLSNKLAHMDQKCWEQSAKLHAGEQLLLERPLSEILWLFHFDLIHHRGQLSTYLRPMGLKVPSIYGRSGDESAG
ncbi:MAG TPA: DinB family protein [Candidatus Acidoferrum sp.]|jgi:uncharacterized damage-inducible protein DinB|nr:DinB family protein [Candidatus Acidoferrum sp.]